MFYTYNQNNSGGCFLHEEGKYGYACIVEAYSPRVADAIAQDLGIYFGGPDCSCCGSRWGAADSWNGYEFPSFYGKRHILEIDGKTDWWGYPVYVHYLNGVVERYDMTDTGVTCVTLTEPK